MCNVHSFFTGSGLYQAQQAGPTLAPSVQEMNSSPPQPPPFQQPEPFVPPEELEIPPEMEIVSITGSNSNFSFKMPSILY